MFNVMCQVSGGMTGFRQGLLKDGDDRVIEFETREAAEAEARRLSEKMNSGYGCASFRYWAKEVF